MKIGMWVGHVMWYIHNTNKVKRSKVNVTGLRDVVAEKHQNISHERHSVVDMHLSYYIEKNAYSLSNVYKPTLKNSKN